MSTPCGSSPPSDLGGAYPHVALIEGNDPRLIDLAVLSRFPLGAVTSWQHATHPEPPGERVFGRDLLEVEVLSELGNVWAAAMSVMDAVRACVVAGDLPGALHWAEIATTDYVALGARDAPNLTELRGVLHARLGEAADAIRLFAGARAQQHWAGMPWPIRLEILELLTVATTRIDRDTYEHAWRTGSSRRLADLAEGLVDQKAHVELLPRQLGDRDCPSARPSGSGCARPRVMRGVCGGSTGARNGRRRRRHLRLLSEPPRRVRRLFAIYGRTGCVLAVG